MSFKKDFWNKKILAWEKSKYRIRIIPKIFDVNSSVKQRLYLAGSMLKQISKGKTVLELGCGSGQLWEIITPLNLKKYTGVDFSDVAIKTFYNKISNFESKDQVFLFCEDCIKNTYSADIVVSLGLFDWIDIEKIQRIAENYRGSWYLHSFSEKQLSFSQMGHSIYSLINYGYKNNYYPFYRSANKLLSVFGPKARIYRNSSLSFSTFIYNLPDSVQFKC